jgi:hypothetical protein
MNLIRISGTDRNGMHYTSRYQIRRRPLQFWERLYDAVS